LRNYLATLIQTELSIYITAFVNVALEIEYKKVEDDLNALGIKQTPSRSVLRGILIILIYNTGS